jgi:predicted ATP-grasp superfamily ATP-dependent carboligase
MTTVFVYEDVTATGAGGGLEPPPAPSLLAEGRAMLEAVAADFAAVSGVRVLRLGELCFRDLAAQADYTLVIAPECGGRLEHLCEEVLQVGGRLLGPSPEAIRRTADKLALARHWERHGVPTPPTWVLGDEPAGVPVVVKPRDGAGSQGMALWRQDSDPVGVAQDQNPVPTTDWPGPLLAQELIPGLAASVAFLIGRSNVIPLVPCQQLLSADGRFTYLGGRLPLAPNLAERATRIAAAAVTNVAGLSGYVGVDVVLGNDGRDWAIEINPRLTTSYVGLRALARFNLAEAMLAVVRQLPPPEMSWHDRWIEFTPDGGVSDVAPTRPAAAST